jgi:hypothetical protein
VMTTCGRAVHTSETASIPLSVAPTTSIPGSLPMNPHIASRMMGRRPQTRIRWFVPAISGGLGITSCGMSDPFAVSW